MSPIKPVTNPYKKVRPLGGHNGNIMGRQSQQRVSNTKRAYQLAASNSFKKSKRGGQQTTLSGGVAFDPLTDCKICVAQAIKRVRPEHNIPKRSHHILCSKNTKTKGKGKISRQTLEIEAEQVRLKALFAMPLETHEKASAKHLTKEAGVAFFSARSTVKNDKKKAQPMPALTEMAHPRSSSYYCNTVSTLTSDSAFAE